MLMPRVALAVVQAFWKSGMGENGGGILCSQLCLVMVNMQLLISTILCYKLKKENIKLFTHK